MKPVDETTVVHFSYRAQPQFAYAFLTEGQSASSPLAKVFYPDELTGTTAFPDASDSSLVAQNQNDALLMLAREEAAYRPRIRPVRHLALASDRAHSRPRSRAMPDGNAVRPAHPTHLLIVSARRPRPARLSASQPIAAAISATRAALYPEVPNASTSGPGLRTAMHFAAVAGVILTIAETAAAQQVLALF